MDMSKLRKAARQDAVGEVRVADAVLRLRLPSTARASAAGMFRVQAATPPREDGDPGTMTPEQMEESTRRLVTAAILEGSSDGGETWEAWDPKADDAGELPMALFLAAAQWIGQAQQEASAQVASFPRG